MEATYLIASLFGVIVGTTLCWFESRWMKERKSDFRPRPIRFILIALILGMAIPLLIREYGMDVKTLGYSSVTIILCIIILVDIDTAKIPNKLVAAGVIVWALTVWFITVPGNNFNIGSAFAPLFGEGFFSVMVDSLLAASVIGGLLLVFSVVYEQATGRPSLGAGDIKLIAMVSLFLGLTGGVFNLILSCVFGLVLGFIWNLIGKQHVSPEGMKSSLVKAKTFPFGPAIALATITTFICGPLLFM